MNKPTILEDHEMFRLYCKGTKQWGLFLSFHENDLTEVFKAAPYLEEMFHNNDECQEYSNGFQAIGNGQCFLFFNDEETLDKYYENTVGDDGPTETSRNGY